MRQLTNCLGILTLSALLSSGCASAPSVSATTPNTKPTTKGTQKQLSGDIRIFVAANQQIHLNGEKLSAKDLLKKLQKLQVQKEAVILLNADPASPFSAVVGLLRSLKDDGYSNVSMQVQKKTDK